LTRQLTIFCQVFVKTDSQAFVVNNGQGVNQELVAIQHRKKSTTVASKNTMIWATWVNNDVPEQPNKAGNKTEVEVDCEVKRWLGSETTKHLSRPASG
jgi:hypothetical protein